MEIEAAFEQQVVADVRVSEALDALYVTARAAGQGVDVVSALKRAVPGVVGLRRTADGVCVPLPGALSLPVSPPGLDLRWQRDATAFVENRRRATEVFPRLLARLREVKAGGAARAREVIADSPGLPVLDDHQAVNVAAMAMPEGIGLCVFDEQGAGKTVTLIFAFDLLVQRDEADVVLVVAPKSMVPEWPKDFERFRGDLYRVSVLTGSARDKRRALDDGSDVLVANFETVVAMEEELASYLRRRGKRAVLTVDESFFIKSLNAQRTRALRRLREWCGRAFVLCGTPAPNAPQDLVQQFSLVDFGLAFQGTQLPDDRIAAAPAVQGVIDGRGLYVRHLKADVLPGLPRKSFEKMHVPLEPMQRRLYETALHDLVLDLESTTEESFRRQIPNFLARRSALLQICSNPAAVAPGYVETPAKLLSLDGLLEHLVEREREKVVVWSFYTHSVTAIVERYARYGALRYDGGVADIGARREAVRRFQEDDQTMLFVANPAAAGAGLTLHRARVAVYESLSNQAAHYLQSLDRIHRRGQTRDVDYVVLLCDGTIEVQEYDRLIRKEAAAQSLLGDQVDLPVTRNSFLTDARAAVALLREAP